MPKVTISGFPIPNWKHGGSIGKLRLYSSETWTDFDGEPHLAGIPGAPTDFYQEVRGTILVPSVVPPEGTDLATLMIPDFQTPPTINSPDNKVVKITGVLLDEHDTVIEPHLFDDWTIPNVPTITWLDLTIFNTGPKAPLGDRFVTTEALLAILAQAGIGGGIVFENVAYLNQPNLFVESNSFQDITATQLTLQSQGAVPSLSPITFLPAPDTNAWILTWPKNHGAGLLRNDGTGLTSWSAVTMADLPAGTTGTGNFVLQNNPTINSPILVTPNLGVAQAFSINGLQIQPTTGAVLNVTSNKTLNVQNSLTLQATDGAVADFGLGGTVAYKGLPLSQFASTTSLQLAGVISDETGTGKLVFATSPTLIAPDIGAAIGTSLMLTGRLGVGTGNPNAKTEIVDATGLPQLRLSYNQVGIYADLSVGSGGILTLMTLGSINFSTNGGHIDPATPYFENLGSLNRKYLALYAAELWVETLVAQNTIATIGGRILVGPTTTLTIDALTAAATITVKHNQMVVNDVCYLEANGKVEFMRVTAGPTGTGPYVYTVARNLDGSGSNDWFAGDAVFNTGQVGSGFMDLYSLFAVNRPPPLTSGPTIVGNVRNSPTYNDWSEHWAIGNLKGVYGYGASDYGVAFGKYAANFCHVTIDAKAGAAGGYRIYNGLNTIIGQWDNNAVMTLGEIAAGKNRMVLDPAVGLRFYNGLTTVVGEWNVSGVITVGEVGAGKSNVQISAGQLNLRNNTSTYIRLNSDGSGYLANSLISWDAVGYFTVAEQASIGAWRVGSTQAITPRNVLGGTFSGGTFTKTAADAAGNCGFFSVESIVGDGFLEWIVDSNVNKEWVVGLSYADANQNYDTEQFAFYLKADTTIQKIVFGGGFAVVGAAVANVTVLKVERVGTTINWYVNGSLVATQAGVSPNPLFADVSVVHNGATVPPLKMVSGAGYLWSGGITLASSPILASNRIYVGSGSYNNAATPFYVDGSGRFSLRDKLTWDGTILAITGSVNATTGTIGGWVIGSDYIRDAGDSVGLASTVTGGDDVRFWAGAAFAARAAAPFRVTEAGVLTSVSGAIGGWTIAAAKISSTGININSGASASLAFGTTPPTGPALGTGLWMDKNGLYATNGSVTQAIFHSLGLTFDVAGTGSIRFESGGGANGYTMIFGSDSAGVVQCKIDHEAPLVGRSAKLWLHCQGSSSNNADIILNSYNTGNGDIRLFANGGTLLGVTIGADSAPTAMLDVRGGVEFNSTTRAFTLMRMTTAQRDAIPSIVDGMVIYNTTTGKFEGRAAGVWAALN